MLVPVARTTAAGHSLEQDATARQALVSWEWAVGNGSRQAPSELPTANDGEEDRPRTDMEQATV